MSNRTEISTLGEFGLIDHLTAAFDINRIETQLSVGDDAAVIQHFNHQTVVTTDMLVEGVHFDLGYMPLQHLGYKAVIVNLSDVVAMGAEPTQITVSIAISNRFSVEAMEELYSGIQHACDRYNVDLVGGDTTTSLSGLVISVTAIGQVKEGAYYTRSNAQVGDLICVSGDLGAAYLGLQLLEREKRLFLENPNFKPNLNNKKHCVGKILRPEARIDILELVENEGIQVNSMIDVSDGLSSELKHLVKQSDVGIEIFENKLPIHEETYSLAEEFELPVLTAALNGGEDYELLFTVPKEDLDKLLKYPQLISIIGEVKPAEDGCMVTTTAGNSYELKAQGWNPLKN